MSNSDSGFKLEDFDAEVISDLIVRLEKSFRMKFEDNAFEHIKTFGDLCDVFERHMQYEHRDDCTSQQAFYRVRTAISNTLQTSGCQISPETKLIDLFPLDSRRQKVKDFKNRIGINVEILTIPDWLGTTLAIGLVLSLLTLFLNWKIALIGITFFYLALYVGEKLGRTLAMRTVRELSEKLFRDHYFDVRRVSGTINKYELTKIIVDTFSEDLVIEKSNLTREAKFSWAK